MKNLGICDIDNTVNALEEAIEIKKMKIQSAKLQSASEPVIPNILSEMLNRFGVPSSQLNNVLGHGGEFAQHFVKNAQHMIQEQPWESLRKVAACSFAVGVFLSRRHKKSTTGKRE